MENKNRVIILGEDQYRLDRVRSVYRTVQDTREDLLDYIESLEDHEGNLDIHCKENTSNEIKIKIVEFFKKVWELHNECSVWIHPPIVHKAPSIWVSVFLQISKVQKVRKLYTRQYTSYESAMANKNSRTSDWIYIKTIELTEDK
jgi:hypothetical protein